MTNFAFLLVFECEKKVFFSLIVMKHDALNIPNKSWRNFVAEFLFLESNEQWASRWKANFEKPQMWTISINKADSRAREQTFIFSYDV